MSLIGFADILERSDEIIKDFSWHHDAVAVRTDLFCNTHHATSCVAFEVNEESLAIRYNFFRANDIVVHCCK